MSKIIKTTIILTIFSLAIRFFGLIREMVFAAFYGASSAMDAFVVASSVPSIFVGVAVTAIVTAFIPIYTEYKINSHYDDAENFVHTIICIVIVITSAIVLICFIFAPQIIFALAPGFNIETQRLATDLLRIMMPMLFFSGLLGIGSSLQQANNQFYYYAFSQLILNIVTIIVIVFFATRYGIFAAGVASVLSIIVQVLIISVGMPSCGYNKFRWNLNLRHPGIRKMVRFIMPVMIGLIIVDINSIVTRILASSLPSGSISALNYAIRVNLVFVSLLIYPVTTTIYPLLSQQFEKNNINDFKRYINTATRLIVFLIIPISTMAAFFPNQLISILFERGVFDKNSTAQTATIFMFYVLGLPGISLMELLWKAFYSMKETIKPLAITTFVIVLNIILSIIFVKTLAAAGLALAASIASTIGVFLQLYFLSKGLAGGLAVRRIFFSIFKAVICCIPMVIIAKIIFYVGITFFSKDIFSIFFQNVICLIIAGIVGFATYGVSSYIFNREDFHIMMELVLRKIPILKGRIAPA